MCCGSLIFLGFYNGHYGNYFNFPTVAPKFYSNMMNKVVQIKRIYLILLSERKFWNIQEMFIYRRGVEKQEYLFFQLTEKDKTGFYSYGTSI